MRTPIKTEPPSIAELKGAIEKMELRKRKAHPENIEFSIAIYALVRELEKKGKQEDTKIAAGM